jgi:hypothetical protein
VVKLSEEAIDVIVEGTYLIFWSCSVLYFVYFFDDMGGNLFAPSFAFVEIVDLSDMT